jgi:hypothetical protein
MFFLTGFYKCGTHSDLIYKVKVVFLNSLKKSTTHITFVMNLKKLNFCLYIRPEGVASRRAVKTDRAIGRPISPIVLHGSVFKKIIRSYQAGPQDPLCHGLAPRAFGPMP